MKRKTTKLELNKQTVRVLSDAEAVKVAGGLAQRSQVPGTSCIYYCDTRPCTN